MMKHRIFSLAGRWYVEDPWGRMIMGSVHIKDVIHFSKRIWSVHKLFVSSDET